MTDIAAPTGYLPDYLKPGMRVVFRTRHMNDKGKLIESVYGASGDITYQGYTIVSTTTFLVFDRVEGAGKKAKREEFAINAIDLPNIKPYESL